MPRTLPVKADRFVGNLFIMLVFLAIFVVYYSVVVCVLMPRFMHSNISKILLGIYHFVCVMLGWCLWQTIMGDPGQVPTFWGFHFGDHESKRKRYCLMCNVFKPERCHHCSTCNRCVLNMDHHCPWVNNCIGFWNRKQFVLLLIYVLLSSYLSFPILTYDLYYRLPMEYEKFNRETRSYTGFLSLAIILFGWVITGAASYLMTNFLRFHIELIFSNKTTIEFLEKKGEQFESPFALSPRENWEQVFGCNKLLWFFPVSWASGHPIGDGVYWRMNPNIAANNNSQQNASQASNRQNSENRRLIGQNDSERNDSSRSENSAKNKNDIKANKENINHQPPDSGRSEVKNPPEDSDKHMETVVNRKDEKNTLIVHSQDKNRLLKNTLIKK
ncbi:unnamed protein product [Moneuplotes crassus]|uniref:Palmitoyltransferase n=2 Tax=Euplotes crassus TaxID=5936 RepID=A0AAD1XHQ9_EUPCR|nr:unnamed protein product [Moneuplotes crassus]